jgi:peptide/nickel transport system substrate-binding protein
MEENSPFIMLVQAASHIGFNAKLSGVQFSDTYRVDLTEVNVLQ